MASMKPVLKRNGRNPSGMLSAMMFSPNSDDIAVMANRDRHNRPLTIASTRAAGVAAASRRYLRFVMLRTLLLSLFALTLLGASARAQDQTAREFTECTDCPTMVGIPAGAFVMGSAASEPGHFDNEGPQHAVTVRAFALAKYDV